VAARGREGWEKTLHKNGKQATRPWQIPFVKNCKQATAYTNHKVPLPKAWGQPPALLGKLLTSIASRLTLPKLHLATSNFAKC